MKQFWRLSRFQSRLTPKMPVAYRVVWYADVGIEPTCTVRADVKSSSRHFAISVLCPTAEATGTTIYAMSVPEKAT